MTDFIKKVVIVGGGTAGWLTANILASQLSQKGNAQGIDVCLVESPTIPTIGVGEGTVPTMRQTLKMIGLSETEFVRECDATFKQSINFVDWLHKPQNGNHHTYQHLFHYPAMPGFDLTPYWLLNDELKMKFEDLVSAQGKACHQGLAPKKITHKEYDGIFDYAYHLDAAKFATLLTKHGIEKHGIRHILANVTGVNQHNNGDICSVDTDCAGRIEGDLFIDCTGFACLLLGKTLGVEFEDKKDILFVDNAVTMQVPYVDEEAPIPSHTISTAQEAGWTWDIGLTQRRGVGYVYSSQYTTHDRAEQVLRDYIGPAAESLNCRQIPMRIGYRKAFWRNNCVAIGLSAGFLEPLEATAILLIEATAKLLVEQFPTNKQCMLYSAKRLNETVRYGWDRVIDFIKLHYYLSRRTDTQFWLDNTHPNSAPDSLLERLEAWRYRVPSESDFFSKYEVFQLENYQYVLYGMDFKTELSHAQQHYFKQAQAQDFYQRFSKHQLSLLKSLPQHRELIKQINTYGMKSI